VESARPPKRFTPFLLSERVEALYQLASGPFVTSERLTTKNPRLNVVLDTDLYATIQKIAKKEGKSMSVSPKNG